MTEYQDVWYESEEGLSLYARDYSNESSKLNLLCMHGLTRNSADFEALCAYLQPRYRLIVADQRGRGRSDYDRNAANYNPGIYIQDMFRLIDKLQLDNLILIGTSMGGLMAMLMAGFLPGKLKGVVLNDVGPVVEVEGLKRIQGYVGLGGPVTSWAEAVARVRSINEAALPDYDEDQWQHFARKLYRENGQGELVLNYDPAIAKMMNQDQDQEQAVPADLWFAFDALKSIPCLVIRGAHSDILSGSCVEEMSRRKPDLQVAQISNRGHTPMLDEAESIAAIDRFLASV